MQTLWPFRDLADAEVCAVAVRAKQESEAAAVRVVQCAVELNFRDPRLWSLNKLADEWGYSRATLKRKVRKYRGLLEQQEPTMQKRD